MIRMSRFLAALSVVAALAFAPSAARADFYRHGPYPGFYGGPRPLGPGAFVAGTLFGLGVGTAIAAPGYYYGPRGFYGPRAYYGPRFYAYGPRAYYGPRYYGPRYYDPRFYRYHRPGYGYYR